MLAAQQERLGHSLPMTSLVPEATTQHLADAIGRNDPAARQGSLVALKPQGSRPPFFCVHPLCGEVFDFVVWARRLDPEQPFYGLRGRGLDGLEAPDTQVEAAAAHYIEAVRVVPPAGRHFLGGYGIGGSWPSRWPGSSERAANTSGSWQSCSRKRRTRHTDM